MAETSLTVAEIDEAIRTILTTGQSVSVEGMSYSKANLNHLYKLRTRISAEQSRASGNRPIFRGFNMSGAQSC